MKVTQKWILLRNTIKMLIPFEDGEIGIKLFCGEFATYLCEQDSLTSAQSVKNYMKVKHTPKYEHVNI